MKTAMQNLIEVFDKVYEKSNDIEKNILASVLNFANKSLEKEKEQIIDAYDEGIINGEADEKGNGLMFYNLYYNQTYNK